MSIYIIDLRNEDEISERYLVSAKDNYTILNIPFRHIGFNTNYINRLSYDNMIYLVCQSGNRSNIVKLEFFINNDNVRSLVGGLNGISIFNGDIAIVSDSRSYSPTTYMKIFVALLTLAIIQCLYFNIDQKYIITILSIILIFNTYQIFQRSCILETAISLYHPKAM